MTATSHNNMDRPEAISWRGRGRWAVPVAYALCFLVVAGSFNHQERRARFAEALAARLHAQAPAHLEELLEVLGQPSFKMRGADRHAPTRQVVLVELSREFDLSLYVGHAAEDGANRDLQLLSGASDPVSLEAPRRDLRTPTVRSWALALLAALGPACLWLHQTRRLPFPQKRNKNLALLALFPLLLYLPYATLQFLGLLLPPR